RAFGLLAARFAQSEAIAVDMPDDTGLDHLAGGIDDAADDTLGPDALPLPPVRVDSVEPVVAPRPIKAVEVPPGHAIDAPDHRRLRAQQRLHRIDDARHRMRLQ